MTKQQYKDYATAREKKSTVAVNCVKAFISGGAICALGNLLLNIYHNLGATLENSKTLVTITLVFLAALFTGLGWFNNIAKHAGAGTLVPITGFANAVVSPAIDNKHEGLVLGVGAKMFIIAGPVIVYGTLASVVYGVIYYFLNLWFK